MSADEPASFYRRNPDYQGEPIEREAATPESGDRPGIKTMGEQRAYQAGYDAGKADRDAPAMELSPEPRDLRAAVEALQVQHRKDAARAEERGLDGVASRYRARSDAVGEVLAIIDAHHCSISEDRLALMLCEGHRICVDHIRGHAAYQEQARRALAWDRRNG